MTTQLEPCAVAGCNIKRLHAGMCQNHYRQWIHLVTPLSELLPDLDLKPRRKKSKSQKEFQRLLKTPSGTKGCIQWKFSRDNKGYAKRSSREHETNIVHRQLAMDLIGDPPQDKPHAMHTCGNGHLGCVNPHHIKWGSAKDNAADKIRHGTTNRGARHYRSELSESDVLEIFSSKATRRELADKFGISYKGIYSIQTGHSWSWLTSPSASAES